MLSWGPAEERVGTTAPARLPTPTSTPHRRPCQHPHGRSAGFCVTGWGSVRELHLLRTQDTLVMHWLVLTTTLRARGYHAISLALPKVTSSGGGPRKQGWVWAARVGQEVPCELAAAGGRQELGAPVLRSHWPHGSRQTSHSSSPSWAGGHLRALMLWPFCLPPLRPSSTTEFCREPP